MAIDSVTFKQLILFRKHFMQQALQKFCQILCSYYLIIDYKFRFIIQCIMQSNFFLISYWTLTQMNACNTIATFEQYILFVESLSRHISFNSLCAKLVCLSISIAPVSKILLSSSFREISLIFNHVMGLSSLLRIIMMSDTCTVCVACECSEVMQQDAVEIILVAAGNAAIGLLLLATTPLSTLVFFSTLSSFLHHTPISTYECIQLVKGSSSPPFGKCDGYFLSQVIVQIIDPP